MGEILPPIAVRFLSVLILTFWAGTALADKRVALIVGNGQYTRISPKLVNPANDANDLAQALAGMGFDVILRTDVGKGQFDQALVEFSRKAKNADTALFYYAGYGLQYYGENFFLPIDIEVQDVADVEFQAVGMNSVQQAIDRSAGVKIVILDASRDNPLAKQFVASRSRGGPGLARIDSAGETIIAYATTPGRITYDGEGRNSPFTAALINRMEEPGLEITTMFRRVANDVYEQTGGKQKPEITSSLRTSYFLIPVESDSIAWSRVRDSTNLADFKEFIRKFPGSPFAREAQFRIDLFDRIRRENEEAKKQAERTASEAEKKRQEEAAKKEAERLALEAQKKRQEEAARKEEERLALEAERKRREEAARKEAERIAFETEKKRQEAAAKKEAERLALEAEKRRQEEAAAKETERLALEAEKKRQEEAAAKKEAERLPLETEKKRQEEAARKEAERRQEEKRAAEERKIAAREEEDRKREEIEQEKQRVARICDGDRNALEQLTRNQQTAAIEKLGKETACPSLAPAIETAVKIVARAVKKERPQRWKILETGYSFLKNIGGEEEGYGLYSYAILVNDGSRSTKFLSAVFGDAFAAEAGIPEPDKHTPNGIPPIEETAAEPYQTNILYITLKRNKADEWSNRLKLGNEAALRAAYAKNYYDYKMSRALLDHLCDSPAEEIKEVCEGDLSRGPYIFTYATPASNVSPVPPPFLFMDLSDVHERAFPEIIAAFKAQVKREDISDRVKIDTLRLKVLNIVLTTADWLGPVQKAIANIVYSPGGHTEKDKQ